MNSGAVAQRPRTLFATHYHELTDIAQFLPRVRNYNFSVREQRDDILFLRKLRPGPASKSYGIAVARLAGLPKSVIDRARAILATFEQGERASLTRLTPEIEERETEQLLAADRTGPSLLVKRLLDLDLEQTSPLQALQILADLQRQAREQD